MRITNYCSALFFVAATTASQAVFAQALSSNPISLAIPFDFEPMGYSKASLAEVLTPTRLGVASIGKRA
jgi:hypothetical protein